MFKFFGYIHSVILNRSSDYSSFIDKSLVMLPVLLTWVLSLQFWFLSKQLSQVTFCGISWPLFYIEHFKAVVYFDQHLVDVHSKRRSKYKPVF